MAPKPSMVTSEPTSSPQVAPQNTPPLELFIAQIREMEGWYASGTVVDSVKYTNGSPSWITRNPGNLRCDPNNKSNWNVLAVGQRNGFCVFPDEKVGMDALRRVTIAQCKGLSTVYNAAAKKLGLKDSGELNLYQYFTVRDPQTDGNQPTALAERFGRVLKVSPTAFKIKELLA